MDNNFREIYTDVEKAIDYAFEGQFVLKFYDYLKVRGTRKLEVDEFIVSKTASEINDLVEELEEYLEGGTDNNHKLLREAYGHIPKPQARKIKNYLSGILDDAKKYSYDRRPGRRKKISK
ncbi:MAG: hypothetical protein ACO3CD_06010 [Candidatus Nanopelagicaceae bacterium]